MTVAVVNMTLLILILDINDVIFRLQGEQMHQLVRVQIYLIYEAQNDRLASASGENIAELRCAIGLVASLIQLPCDTLSVCHEASLEMLLGTLIALILQIHGLLHKDYLFACCRKHVLHCTFVPT